MAGNGKLKLIHHWDPFIFLRTIETVVLECKAGKTCPEAPERNQKDQTTLVLSLSNCWNGAVMLWTYFWYSISISVTCYFFFFQFSSVSAQKKNMFFGYELNKWLGNTQVWLEIGFELCLKEGKEGFFFLSLM